MRSAMCAVLALYGCARAPFVVTVDAGQVIPPAPEPPAVRAAASATAPEAARVPGPASSDASFPDFHFELTVAPGVSCKLAIHTVNNVEEPEDGWWFVTSVDRIRTEASSGCVDATVFDLAAEVAAEPNPAMKQWHVPLDGGKLRNAVTVPDPNGLFVWGVLDMNFDGYLDVAVPSQTGSYFEMHRNWIYDPKARTLVTSALLDELAWPSFDAASKVVHSHYEEEVGPRHEGTYGWLGLTLVPLELVDTGVDKPNGEYVGDGFHWVTRRQRHGGKLVTVFAGAVKDR